MSPPDTSVVRVGALAIDATAVLALRAFHEAMAPHRDDVNDHLLLRARAMPELGPIIASMSEEQRLAQNELSLELERAAFYDGDWEPYLLNLRMQGEIYAGLGMSFDAWYEILAAFKDFLLPRVVKEFGHDQPALIRVLTGTDLVLDITMPVIAKAYHEAVTRQLQASNEALEVANQELDAFAYIASHDLKAPLRAIGTLAEWVQEELVDVDVGEVKEHLTLMRGRVRRMSAMIDGLLAYSRAGREAEDDEAVDTRKLVEEVVDFLAPDKGFTVEISEELPVLHTQRVPLRHVLLNLVSNALKHHDKETGTVRVSAEPSGALYKFSVTDDGPGVPEKFRERVFETFQTLRPRDEVEGTGIGLAIVRKTVTRFGGDVEIQSAEPCGAVFTFTWQGAVVPRGDARAQ